MLRASGHMATRPAQPAGAEEKPSDPFFSTQHRERALQFCTMAMGPDAGWTAIDPRSCRHRRGRDHVDPRQADRIARQLSIGSGSGDRTVHTSVLRQTDIADMS